MALLCLCASNPWALGERNQAVQAGPGALVLFPGGELTAQSQQQPPPQPSTPAPDRPGQRPQTLPSVIFLSGRVVLPEGGPPPQPVNVDLVCDGQRVRQVTTQADGRFSVELGSHRPPGSQDTLEAGTGLTSMSRDGSGRLQSGGVAGLRPAGPGRVDMSTCFFRTEAFEGYASTRLVLGIRRTQESPEVGDIVLQRQGETSGSTVDLNQLAVPPKAKAAYEDAKKELDKPKADYKKVARHLEKAVEEYPEFSAAWGLLGQTRIVLGQSEQARQDFQRAIQTDSANAKAYLDLARLDMQEKRWPEAEQNSQSLIELNPGVVEGYYIHGVSNYYLEKPEVAEAAFQKLEAANGSAEYPMSLFLHGMIEARRGATEDAAGHFRRFLDLADDKVAPAGLRQKIEQQLKNWEESGLVKPPN